MTNLEVEIGIAERRVIKLQRYHEMKPDNIHVTQSYSNAKDKLKYLKWLNETASVEILDARPE